MFNSMFNLVVVVARVAAVARPRSVRAHTGKAWQVNPDIRGIAGEEAARKLTERELATRFILAMQ